MSNSNVVLKPGEKPPFNIHDAMCGDHLFYGIDDRVKRLIEQTNRRLEILDFRSACGRWAYQVATKYPDDVNVTGLDDRAPPNIDLPSNLQFRKFDTIDSNSVGQLQETFDIIHARAASATVINFTQVINDFVARLRPGGILVLTSGELNIFRNSDGQIAENLANHKILRNLYAFQKNIGRDMDSMYNWENILAAASGKLEIYRSTIRLHFKAPAESAGAVPDGATAEELTDDPCYVTKFMDDTLKFFAPKIAPEELVKEAQHELTSGTLSDMHLQWILVHAVMPRPPTGNSAC